MAQVRSLFPTGPQAQAQNNALVSFRAGLMTDKPVAGTPKVRVTADPRKGEARLVKGGDGLVYFQWLVRGSSHPERNLVIFPGDAKLSQVDTKREGDRVYQLKFNSGGRRIYLWMQEPLVSADEANVKRMNDCIDNPGAAQPAGGAGVSPEMLAQLLGGAGAGGNAQAQRLAAALQQSGGGNLASLLGLGGAGGGAPGAAGGAAGGGADPMAGMMMDEDAAMQAALAASLADIEPAAPAPAPALAPAPAAAQTGGNAEGSAEADGSGDTDMTAEGAADGSDASGDGAGGAQGSGSGSNAAAAASGAGGAGAGVVTLEALAAAMQAVTGQAEPPTSLRHVVDLQSVLPMLQDEAVQARLLPLLPESQRTPQGLVESVSSPEFQGALATLSAALQTNNFNSVFANFGLDPADGAEHMARGDGIAAFLHALEARARRKDHDDGDDAEGDGDGDGDN